MRSNICDRGLSGPLAISLLIFFNGSKLRIFPLYNAQIASFEAYVLESRLSYSLFYTKNIKRCDP